VDANLRVRLFTGTMMPLSAIKIVLKISFVIYVNVSEFYGCYILLEETRRTHFYPLSPVRLNSPKGTKRAMLLQNKRLFVVEDGLNNRVVYHMLLINQGAVFEFDRWGTGTLAKLRAFAPVDLIVLDLMLPRGISGFDVYDEIRAENLFDAVPIVAVSASDPSMTIPKVRAKGFAGFIAKPIDSLLFPNQLIQIINGEAVWYEGQG
jgi:CheY-like chemotaxis protein